jgi:hypothetical protein
LNRDLLNVGGFRGNGYLPLWLGLAVVAVLALEYISIPVPYAEIATGAQVPPVYRWLAAQAFEGAVFELPTARTSNITDDQLSIRRMATQQYFSVYHFHPIVIGYSGTNAPTFKDVIDYSPAAASPDGIAFLRALGVSRIVVHRDQMSWDEWATFAESAARQPDLELVAQIGDSSVYAVGPGASVAEAQWRPVDIEFGPALTLSSLDLPSNLERTVGEAFVVWLEWMGDPVQARELAVSLQILDSAERKVAQADYFFPLRDPWPPGEPLVQRSVIALPRDLAPGEYQLQAIVYRQSDLATVAEPATLAHVRVSQPPELLIQHAHPARLGTEAQLLGYDAELSVRRGETLPVALYWRRLGAIPDDYTVFVHLRRPDGTVLAQQDNPPRGGTYPTSAWREGETVIDRYALSIPADAPPGAYTLAIGMYLPPGAERLPAYDENGDLLPGESVILGTVEVTP